MPLWLPREPLGETFRPPGRPHRRLRLELQRVEIHRLVNGTPETCTYHGSPLDRQSQGWLPFGSVLRLLIRHYLPFSRTGLI
jgi:hypothetical protein